jgi:hypothetical protein
VHALHPTDGDFTARGSVVVWVILGVIVSGFVLSLIGKPRAMNA